MTTEPCSLDIFAAAKHKAHRSGELEIDIPPTEKQAEEGVSRGDDGAWVQAWVWVDYDEV